MKSLNVFDYLPCLQRLHMEFDQKILDTLTKADRPLRAMEIQQRTDNDWNCQAYAGALRRLKRLGFVKREEINTGKQITILVKGAPRIIDEKIAVFSLA